MLPQFADGLQDTPTFLSDGCFELQSRGYVEKAWRFTSTHLYTFMVRCLVAYVSFTILALIRDEATDAQMRNGGQTLFKKTLIWSHHT